MIKNNVEQKRAHVIDAVKLGFADILAVCAEIETNKRKEMEEARGKPCPFCGDGATVATHSMFMEIGVGLRERLIAVCPNGHEWAVHDPEFRWEKEV